MVEFESGEGESRQRRRITVATKSWALAVLADVGVNPGQALRIVFGPLLVLADCAGQDLERLIDEAIKAPDLPHVARPVVGRHRLQRLGRTTHPRPVPALGLFIQEVLYERRDVFPPLPQRHEHDLPAGQAVVEVLLELLSRHQLAQRLPRRHHEPHVRDHRALEADGRKAVPVQRVAQRRLELSV